MSRRPPRTALVLAVWLLALLGAALVIVRTPFVADLSAFLPASSDAQQRVLIEQIRSGAPARTLMLAIDGGTAVQRAAASRALAAALRASGRFEQVSNGEQEAWAEMGSWVFAHRYQLSPAVTPDHFSPAGLRDAIDETLGLLGTPAGDLVKPLLYRDPTGETQRIAEAMIPTSAPRSVEGVWAARQGERAVLLASTRAEGADLDGQAAAIALVRQSFVPHAEQGLTLLMSGSPVFGVDSRAQIEREVQWLAIAGTLLMSALLLVAFASPLALGVAMLPVASGVVAGIAAVGLGYGSVHGVTLGFGSTLIGEAVDYSIYFLIQSASQPGGRAGADGADSEPGWRRWLRQNWPTVRLGLLTSLCGFAALVFSGFPGLAQLGVFSIAGLLAAALTTRFVLPQLLPDGSRGVGLRRQLGRAARVATLWLPRTKWLWVAAGLACAVAVWRDTGLWSADLAALSPVSKQALALDASLRGELGNGDGGALVVVQGPDAETVLQRVEAAGTRLDALVQAGTLAGYTSVARLLPSVRSQQARLAALPDTAALQAALAEATRGGALRAERLTPFVEAMAQARQLAPVTPDQARRGPLAPLVNSLMLQRADGSWSALLPVTPPAGQEVDTTRVGQALQGLAETRVLDIGSELRRMYGQYLGEAQAQALVGAAAVVLLVALTLRAPARVLAVCQPLALAVVLLLGALALLDVPIGILHLVGLLLVVAVGSNYALFFDLLRDDPAADDNTLASLLLANLTTVLSFGLIASSQIPALSAIGQVVAPGALLALVLSAAFAPRAVQPAAAVPTAPRPAAAQP